MFSGWREVRDTNAFTYNLELEPLKSLTVFEYNCNSYLYFCEVFHSYSLVSILSEKTNLLLINPMYQERIVSQCHVFL